MKILLAVDGSNLYHRLREISLWVDYNELAEWLTKGDEVAAKRFYVGRVKANPESEKAVAMMSSQQKMLANLKKAGWEIAEGYLLNSGDGTYHEKGVDVKMANDIVLGAVRKTYEKAILLTSDNDMIPAVTTAIEEGCKVEYVGFSHKPSYGLIKNCTDRRLIAEKDLMALPSTHTIVPPAAIPVRTKKSKPHSAM